MEIVGMTVNNNLFLNYNKIILSCYPHYQKILKILYYLDHIIYKCQGNPHHISLK